MELIELLEQLPGRELTVGAAQKLSKWSELIDGRVVRELGRLTRERRVIDRNDATKALACSRVDQLVGQCHKCKVTYAKIRPKCPCCSTPTLVEGAAR